MTSVTDPPKADSKVLLRELSTRLNTKPTDVQQRILAHIRETTGHNTLPAFINNGHTEAEKVAVLSVCIRAVLTGDFTALKGNVPSGQAKASPVSQESPGLVSNPQSSPESQPAAAPAPAHRVKSDGETPPATPNPMATCSPEIAKHFGLDKLPPHIVTVVDNPPPGGWKPEDRVPNDHRAAWNQLPELPSPALDAAMAALKAALQPPPPAAGPSVSEDRIREIVREELEAVRKSLRDGLFNDARSLIQQEVLQAKCELAKGCERDVDERLSTIAEAIQKAA